MAGDGGEIYQKICITARDALENLCRRTIEKSRKNEIEKNKTSGCQASNIQKLTELDEKVLSIIKYACPIDLNGSTDSFISTPPIQQLPPAKISKIYAPAKISQTIERAALWKEHYYALKSYTTLLGAARDNMLPEELVELAKNHLHYAMKTSKQLYNEE